MRSYRTRLFWAAMLAVVFAVPMLGGCAKNGADTPSAPGPPQPGAPSSAQVAAQRAVAEQHMSQSREMAIAAWRQSHPGQKLPPGF